jgi:sec-independent protein translocase protein TatA
MLACGLRLDFLRENGFMGMSFWHLLLILIVVFTVFGAGKLPKVMGDVGRGIRNLREGLKHEDEAAAQKIEQKDKSS